MGMGGRPPHDMSTLLEQASLYSIKLFPGPYTSSGRNFPRAWHCGGQTLQGELLPPWLGQPLFLIPQPFLAHHSMIHCASPGQQVSVSLGFKTSDHVAIIPLTESQTFTQACYKRIAALFPKNLPACFWASPIFRDALQSPQDDLVAVSPRRVIPFPTTSYSSIAPGWPDDEPAILFGYSVNS